jgi:hypothetical protein
MNRTVVSRLEARLSRLDELIAAFEQAREEIGARRRAASDNVLVDLDQRLEVNARMIEVLQRTRGVVLLDLQQERGR